MENIMTSPQQSPREEGSTATPAGRDPAVLVDAEFAVPPAQADVTVPPVQADVVVLPAEADIAMPRAEQASMAEPAELQSVAGTAATTSQEIGTPSASDPTESERPVADAVPGTEISGSEPTPETCQANKAAAIAVATESVVIAGSSAVADQSSGDEKTAGGISASATPRLPDGQAGPAAHRRRTRIEVPKDILSQLLFSRHRRSLQNYCRQLPIVAGENPADYFELLKSNIEEWEPLSPQEVFCVKHLTDTEWELLRWGDVRKWLFNVAIAEGLVAQIVDLEVERSGDEKQLDRTVHPDPGVELCVRQGWLRSVRRIAFDAVAGDDRAIAFVEKQIGTDAVAMGPRTIPEFERSIPAHLSTDRLINAGLVQRDRDIRQLLKLAAERQKRIASKHATADDLSQPEYIKLMVGRVRHQEEAKYVQELLGYGAPRETNQIAQAVSATDKSGGSANDVRAKD
jgi:hypothetical protein